MKYYIPANSYSPNPPLLEKELDESEAIAAFRQNGWRFVVVRTAKGMRYSLIKYSPYV